MLRCPGVISGLFIMRQILNQYILKLIIIILDYMMRFMKMNLQINEKMIEMNKQRYFMSLLGIEWCLWVSWGNRSNTPYSAKQMQLL